MSKKTQKKRFYWFIGKMLETQANAIYRKIIENSGSEKIVEIAGTEVLPQWDAKYFKSGR